MGRERNHPAYTWYYNKTREEQNELSKKHIGRRNTITMEKIIEIYDVEVNGKPFTAPKRREVRYPVNFIGITASRHKLAKKEPLTESEMDNLHNFLYMIETSKSFTLLTLNKFTKTKKNED